MKNKIYYITRALVLFSVTIALTMVLSCNKEDDSSPFIENVRMYEASPGDSIVSSLEPGQWVVLSGRNLKNAVQINFNGIPANFNHGLFSNNQAVVQIPSVIPFPTVPEEKLNTIEYITSEGATVFYIDILAPAPVITAISNENPQTGDEVTIYGTNLFLMEEVTFSGISITDYESSDDGTFITFTVLELTNEGGPVSVTTPSGFYTTTYNVNDVETGVLSNVDDIFNWEWWGGASYTSGNPDFLGNDSQYFVLNYPSLPSGQGAEWSHAIRISTQSWMSVENLPDPVGNWAIKFEINVPEEWNGGTICLKSVNNDYLARYAPWQTNNTYSTDGWRTVTIPLTTFRLDGGIGAPLTNISDLIGTAGSSNFIAYIHNYQSSEIAFYAAFDNFRVVQILE